MNIKKFSEFCDNDNPINESTRVERFKYDITENLKKISQAEGLYVSSRQKLIELSDNLYKLLDKAEKIDSKLLPILNELKHDVDEMIVESYIDMKQQLNSIANKLLSLKDINIKSVQASPEKDTKIKSTPEKD